MIKSREIMSFTVPFTLADIRTDPKKIAEEFVERNYVGTVYKRRKIMSFVEIVARSDLMLNPNRFDVNALVETVSIVRDRIVLAKIAIIITPTQFISSIDNVAIITTNVSTEGIVRPNMIVPIIVEGVAYSQDVYNIISVCGKVHEPQTFPMTVVELVPKDTEPITNVKELMTLMDSCSKMGRYKFFKQWIHPRKNVADEKHQVEIDASRTVSFANVFDMIKQPPTKKIYVAFDDTYTDGCFSIIESDPKLVSGRYKFGEFAQMIVEELLVMYKMIEEMCRVYESDTVFGEHKAIFEYSSSQKK